MSLKKIDRRHFFRDAATTTAAISIVPRNVLGGRHIPPSDRINVGYIGTGTQGIRQLMQALPEESLYIRSVCDPNEDTSDYIPWSRFEIRNKIRTFLNDSQWGAGDDGCRCGRQVGQEIVERHYGMKNRSGRRENCSAYSDFREMLDKENELDAVYIMTPDHLHATIAIAAMKQGKHVITHKPISNVLNETLLAIDTARRESGLAAQMFCSADAGSTPVLKEWISSGAIGGVREVHNWSSRPFWPQGMAKYPGESISVPRGFDWQLWLGPVPNRPYNPALTHAVFRGWYDFGAGALGDMGHYSFYQIFKILNLGSPTRIEASRSQYYAIVDHLWEKQINRVSYPRASMIRWEFPAREGMPDVALHWYDGGLRPPKPEELSRDGEEMPTEGLLFIGDQGKILAGFRGESPRLIPKSLMNSFTPPPRTLPEPDDELQQWIRGCRGEAQPDANFSDIAAFCETICLGNIALRVDQKLDWDSRQRRFTNSEEANQLMHREYRPGWELT